eukprot:362869-Chlamydomonas_euryale.AAC.2
MHPHALVRMRTCAPQTYAFVALDWRLLSSALLTMAWCKAAERFCNWWCTLEPREPLSTMLSKVFSRHRLNGRGGRGADGAKAVREAMEEGAASMDVRSAYALAAERIMQRRQHTVEGSPLGYVVGFLEWVLLAVVMTAWYVLQFLEVPTISRLAREWWFVVAYAYLGGYVAHFALTQRLGYIVSLSHMLRLPKVFRASSSLPDPQCWIYQPLRLKLSYFVLNVLFWVLVLAMKASAEGGL